MPSQRPAEPPGNGGEQEPKRVRKKYLCKCVKYCNGRPTSRAKSTYFRHRVVEKLAAAANALTETVRRKRKDTRGRGDAAQGDVRAAKRARVSVVEEAAEANQSHDIPEPQPEGRYPSPRTPSPGIPPLTPVLDPFADPLPIQARPPRATVADDEDEDAGSGANGELADDGLEEVAVTLEDMKRALDVIKIIKGATLDSPHSGLTRDVREQLQHPPEEILEIDDDDHLYSIEIYLALHNASQQCYTNICEIISRRDPDRKLLSFYQVKRKVEILTGIVPIINDMCVRSCVAFTGAYQHMEECPKCQEPRYDELNARAKNGGKKVARQQFYTMPLGPQIQPQYRTPEGAESMGYLSSIVEDVLEQLEATNGLNSFDDVSHGSRFWGAYASGKIGPNDVVVMLSIDGAQLYRSKKSDCWIYIWVILNLGPDKRYRRKHVLPGAVIPGPNHPKDLDSFLFPGLFHVSALMREGLKVWDAAKKQVLLVYIFLALILADGPAMALMSGMVGHTGRRGCRVYCPLIWRRKPRLGTYYPAMLQPAEPYAVAGCSHGDVNRAMLEISPADLAAEYRTNEARLLASRTPAEHELVRKETGLSKPSIFSGLSRTFDLPTCFPLDYMHLVALNITDLFVSLWRGTISGSQQDASSHPWAVLQDDVWLKHGAEVARAASFLPGSFDRPPRNIAEKISSGYKAKEWMTYFYGYGPAMLRRVLPPVYLRNYSKFVAAGWLMGKTSITKEELGRADRLASSAEVEYEHLYYARDPDLLHHVRPCVHAFGHAARQVLLFGPLPGYTQYIMERSIGDLGGEIRLPSNPFANLSERALLRCQVNAIKAMFPALDVTACPRLPRGSLDLGDNFVLLRAKDRYSRWVPQIEARAFYQYLQALGHRPACSIEDYSMKVQKWARLRLPNNQVARSAWKETLKPLFKLRMARVVQVLLRGRLEIGEVRYYCRVPIGDSANSFRMVALVSLFRARDEQLYEELNGTVWLARYQGDDALEVVDVKTIQSVVGMVPDSDVQVNVESMTEPHFQQGARYFLVEKLGLEASHRSGALDTFVEDEE